MVLVILCEAKEDRTITSFNGNEEGIPKEEKGRRRKKDNSLSSYGGLCWIRTSDLFHVKEAL